MRVVIEAHFVLMVLSLLAKVILVRQLTACVYINLILQMTISCEVGVRITSFVFYFESVDVMFIVINKGKPSNFPCYIFMLRVCDIQLAIDRGTDVCVRVNLIMCIHND